MGSRCSPAATACTLCRLKRREGPASLLPASRGLFLVSIIPFNGSIMRAFVFLINKLDPSCCFYGADKYLCSEASALNWSTPLSVRAALVFGVWVWRGWRSFCYPKFG